MTNSDPIRISDDQHNNAPAVPEGWRDFLTELSKQKPEKPDYWSSCGQCERNSSTAEDLIAATPAPAPAQGKPFGHFRAEPFGWTDCAEDDEGAIALYEHPAKPAQEAGLTDEWAECKRISELPEVDEALRLFAEGETSEDQAVAIVQTIAQALRAKGAS